MEGSFKAIDNHKPFDNETLRLTKNDVKIEINTVSGQEGEIWVCYSPSIQVSGYGDTYEDAFESYRHNIELFLKDLMVMKPFQQQKELRDLGWNSIKFRKKQYSKAFVDDQGVLQNLTNGKVEGMKTFA